MKMLTVLFSICAALVLSSAAAGQTKWKTYQNARYDYSILYPSDLLAPQGEADNGDGQVFSNEWAEMRVFGTFALAHETLKKEFEAVIAEREKIAYKLLRKNFFVVSGETGERIFYQKTVAKPGGAFVTFYIEYQIAQRADYDPITRKIVAGFR